MTYFKAYAKKVLDVLKEEKASEEDVAKFQKESINFAKFVANNFD